MLVLARLNRAQVPEEVVAVAAIAATARAAWQSSAAKHRSTHAQVGAAQYLGGSAAPLRLSECHLVLLEVLVLLVILVLLVLLY